MKTKKTKQEKHQENARSVPSKSKKVQGVVDLDKVGDINQIEVSVNGRILPFKIGDKIEFPAGCQIYKTICSVKVDENGSESYLLQWFENGAFAQYWVSLTELKLMKDNLKARETLAGFSAAV